MLRKQKMTFTIDREVADAIPEAQQLLQDLMNQDDAFASWVKMYGPLKFNKSNVVQLALVFLMQRLGVEFSNTVDGIRMLDALKANTEEP
jgi:hypothetical protein